MVVWALQALLCRLPRVLHPAQLHLAALRMGKNHVPERWTDYIPVGKRIPGTRFVAFKVPLKKLYENKLSSKQQFSTSDLVEEIKRQNEELGLIVDLTCTTRYYRPEELPKSLCYTKLFTAGHEVPSDDVIYQFKCIVDKFLSENSGNDKLIGVHCTHGLNRTGYLVCRYLIDVLGMVPADAIEKFNLSRGHCMERKNYLDDLMYGKMRSNKRLSRGSMPIARHQNPLPKNYGAVPACTLPPRGHVRHTRVTPVPPYPPMQAMQTPQFPHVVDNPYMQSRGGGRHRYPYGRPGSHNFGKRKPTNTASGPAQNQSGRGHPYRQHQAPNWHRPVNY
ncbi:RNA/RNP complex-1-interacting phosphatase isoform X4 [Pelobates fuscus]|uniref:RNA/RNP complex-1-interacting phosphatase isoform X4 n=1 Tax=Pelobates fuscus TaxID=191477 RepID=UPI002FE4988D